MRQGKESLTAIVCCRPMLDSDIFLVRVSGRQIFPMATRKLLDMGIIDKLVVAISKDVPPAIVENIKRDGISERFDVFVSCNTIPQQRILEVMKHYALSEALVLNGYSFFVDETIVDLLRQRRAAGDNLAAHVSKTPFRYACMMDMDACMALCAPEQPALPPNRLHCYYRHHGSGIRSSLVRAAEDYSPLDDCFWLLALGARHGRGDALLRTAIHRFSGNGTEQESFAMALNSALLGINVDIPRLTTRYGAKSVHLYFKNRREVEFTWLPLLGRKADGGTFLEVGSGDSPYLSRQFARHFDRGICFDPFVSSESTRFCDRLSIASELDAGLEMDLPHAGREPGQLDYHQCDLYALDMEDACVDFCFSRSVLEHVGDFRVMASELRRIIPAGGVMLHAVDFTAHDQRQDDNIFPFYAHAKQSWLKRAPHLINLLRLPDILHILDSAGFETQVVQRNVDSRIPARIHDDWREYSREDLICGGAFIRCVAR